LSKTLKNSRHQRKGEAWTLHELAYARAQVKRREGKKGERENVTKVSQNVPKKYKNGSPEGPARKKGEERKRQGRRR